MEVVLLRKLGFEAEDAGGGGRGQTSFGKHIDERRCLRIAPRRCP